MSLVAHVHISDGNVPRNAVLHLMLCLPAALVDIVKMVFQTDTYLYSRWQQKRVSSASHPHQ